MTRHEIIVVFTKSGFTEQHAALVPTAESEVLNPGAIVRARKILGGDRHSYPIQTMEDGLFYTTYGLSKSSAATTVYVEILAVDAIVPMVVAIIALLLVLVWVMFR